MNLYQMNEAEFILPVPAQDQSLHVFAFHDPSSIPKPGQKPEFSFVVSRELLKPEQTLFSYAGSHLQSMKQNLDEYQLLKQEDAILDGQSTITAEFSWKSDFGLMRQWQVYVVCPLPAGANFANGARTLLSLTGTSLETLHEKYAFLFQQLIYSFSFRR